MFDISGFSKQVTPAVGFHMAVSRDKSNPPSNIEFDVVLRHYGNCWNGASKMFVAPVTGMYSFQLTIMKSYHKKATSVHLMHENKVLQRAYADGQGPYLQTTASAMVKVNKGEHYGRLASGILHSNGNYWCNLVGFFVKNYDKLINDREISVKFFTDGPEQKSIFIE